MISHRAFAFLAGTFVAMLAFGGISTALEAMQHWEAFSITAEGITGDIDLSPSRIVFENGTFFELSYVGSATGIVYGESMPAKIYRIVNPQNPILLHGNALCSEIPYYVAWVEYPNELISEWNMLHLSVVKGAVPPRANMDRDRVCSEYSFTRVVRRQ